MQPRLSHRRIKKTMGNSLGSTELAHLEPTLPGVKNFHVPKTIAHRILGHRRFLNNFGRNSEILNRARENSHPFAFARASSTQAMIGCSKQWFTLFLEKEKKGGKQGKWEGKTAPPPPPRGHSSGWCLRKQYGPFKLFYLRTLFMGSYFGTRNLIL